jgi:hypothetical protein
MFKKLKILNASYDDNVNTGNLLRLATLEQK